MYARRLTLPDRSFLLLGPRGTGKTTWLRAQLPRAHWYNLLLDRELLRLMRDPGSFRRELEALPRGSWVVVDEVQKLPSLLNEIHDALASAPRRWRFALTGSSARKLRRENVNLLAGRVVTRRMLPLAAAELGGAPAPDDLLRFGGLPLVRSERSIAARIDLLEAYVETYLTQEIRAEALVRSLDSFARFLEVAALANAQVTSVASLARDSAVARASCAHCPGGCASRSRPPSAACCSRRWCFTSCARRSRTRVAGASLRTIGRLPGRRWISSGPVANTP